MHQKARVRILRVGFPRMSELRIGEAAQLLGVSADTVRRLADEGRLETRRTAGGHRVVDGVSLARYVAVLAVPTSATASTSEKVHGDVTVLAASSLTEAFTTIGRGFEHKYPRTHVMFSFASTATLVTQIQQGAPADVVASADDANMH